MKKLSISFLVLSFLVCASLDCFSANFLAVKKSLETAQQKLMGSANDAYMEYKSYLGTSEVGITKVYMKMDMYRVDVLNSMMNIGSTTSIVKDGQMWVITPFGSNKDNVSEEILESMKSNFLTGVGPLIVKDVSEGKFIGYEKVSGVKCQVFSFPDKESKIYMKSLLGGFASMTKSEEKLPDSTIKIFIDPLDNVLLKASDTTKPDKEGKKSTITWSYSDFRKMYGRRVPFVHKTFIDGELYAQIVIKDFKVDAGMSDSLFNADKAVAEREKNAKMYVEMKDESGQKGNSTGTQPQVDESKDTPEEKNMGEKIIENTSNNVQTKVQKKAEDEATKAIMKGVFGF